MRYGAGGKLLQPIPTIRGWESHRILVRPRRRAVHQRFRWILLGNNFEGELPQVGNTFQFSDNFSKVIGNHSIKFGGDFRYQKFDQTLYFDINGQYLYFGGGPNDPGFSDLFPNYLLGLVDQYGQGSAQEERQEQSGLLVGAGQLEVEANVTLNYGLRWELNSPLTDQGQKVQTFIPGQNSTIYPCQLFSGFRRATSRASESPTRLRNTGDLPTGLVVPGDKGIPRGLTHTYYKSFAPRIGMAWSQAPKTDPGRIFRRAGEDQRPRRIRNFLQSD